MQISDVFLLQFPLKLSQHQDKTAADHLGLNYVTERILASVLPHRVQTQRQQQKRDNELADGPHIGDAPTLDESPQDIYEQELISMLEQKHGKVNTNCNQSIAAAFRQQSIFFFRSFACSILNLIDSCVCSSLFFVYVLISEL